MQRQIFCLLLLVAAVNAYCQQPVTRPSRELPAPEPAIQKGIQSITDAPTYREMFPAMSEIIQAKARDKFTDEQWLTQVLLFMSTTKNEQQWWLATTRVVEFLKSKNGLGISPQIWIKTLSPYLESADPQVARMAAEMLRASGALIPDGPGQDVFLSRDFHSIGGYLQSLANADPSWGIVGMMYQIDPDAALQTTSSVYLDREARSVIDGARKELVILILSYDLATEEKKSEFRQKIMAKLGELARHSHWCVRAYVVAIISQNANAPIRDPRWVQDPALPDQLLNDANPLVSLWAADIARKLRQSPKGR